MIDFQSGGLFARLKKVADNAFGNMISDFLIAGETIVGTYQGVRDGVVFTNKRIIAINVQGLTGKKKDFTSIPYSKITTFSLETAGVFDLDAELEIYMSAVGKVKFNFTGNTDVKEICRFISQYALQ
ncbi:MAG: PH domain-containing protein [Clostridiales bacterium]|nr:PH domain-containing protein [Clostridiales bacterium]MBO5335300.1 PH domain-containing protein [Clostridia bacterium]MBQ8352364.1 PH domain-containing protein [Clostridia bacterium]